MYDTDKPTQVELLCHVSAMKAVVDNFGIDVDTKAVDESYGLCKPDILSVGVRV